jgi:hypothetical protein
MRARLTYHATFGVPPENEVPASAAAGAARDQAFPANAPSATRKERPARRSRHRLSRADACNPESLPCTLVDDDAMQRIQRQLPAVLCLQHRLDRTEGRTVGS